MELLKTIVQLLPYSRPFLFVDEITSVNENGCEGFYTFREDEYFYQGHFKNHPVTPGVILTECMAQIGLVCLGIYLVESSKLNVEGSKLNVEEEKLKVRGGAPSFAFSESNILFERAVYPGEKVKVVSQKMYWRLGKLKCRVEMFNEEGKRVCSADLSGIISNEK